MSSSGGKIHLIQAGGALLGLAGIYLAYTLLAPIFGMGGGQRHEEVIVSPPATKPTKPTQPTQSTVPDLTQTNPPPLEKERKEAEARGNDSASEDVKIGSEFECGTLIKVQKISATHYKVAIANRTSLRDWFMFRVDGAKGKTIRIDLGGEGVEVKYWSSLNPVYTDATDLDEPATYASVQTSNYAHSIAWNGPELPSTLGQQWSFIQDVWMDGGGTFSFVKHFDSDSAYVAMRVPYPPGLNEQYFHQLSQNPLAKVFEIGRSAANRPLLLVKIGAGDEAAEQKKPCILFYGGEFANEPDGMWFCRGVIEHLLADNAQAAQLRDRYTFLVIPVLDPDTSFSGGHSGFITQFMIETETPETVAYANWFQTWVNEGNRLDIVFDMNNVQSKGYPQVSCAIMEGLGARGKAADALHALIVKNLLQSAFRAAPKPWMRGWTPDRLSGWLSRRYGPLSLAYELNSQAAYQHLNFPQIKDIGGSFVDSSTEFISSADGAALLSEVDLRRQQRLARWAKHGPVAAGTNAINAEADVSKGVGIARTPPDGVPVEKWVP